MGVVHDDWQQGLGRAILAKRASGLYAAGIGGVVLSTCRQVGKTFTFGTLIFALCVLMPGTTVLWTAHHTKTSDETFEALEAMTLRSQIAPYIDTVTRGNGKQAIRFKNGSRILFGAREHGFGRGIPGVTIVVFDEAQILKQSALNDMIPAANTVKNPLILYMGTPPDPKDPSEVFKGRRRKALAVEAARASGETKKSDTLYVEIGADTGADLDDPEQHAKGNPSYPLRTPAESIQRLREQLGDDASFAREGLGIWDDDQEGSRAISASRWTATGVVAPPEGTQSFGVAFSVDGTRLALAGAVAHGSDETHVELIDASSDHGGLAPLADWFCEKDSNGVARWRRAGVIVIGGSAGAGVLKQLLLDRRVSEKRIKIVSTPQYLQACVMFSDAIETKTATHLTSDGQRVLDDAVAFVDRDKRGGWMSTLPDGDETPVEAVSLALWGARTNKRKPAGSNERKAVFL
ncbi:hypothetical protein ACL9RL_09360 [Plantibacter sp. Mn2098]|uniref:hypothetical protein n=1 Tax=Plantibacter sp. Mn2098 TaxID=3395266 RepID=UPI003BE56B2B